MAWSARHSSRYGVSSIVLDPRQLPSGAGSGGARPGEAPPASWSTNLGGLKHGPGIPSWGRHTKILDSAKFAASVAYPAFVMVTCMSAVA